HVNGERDLVPLARFTREGCLQEFAATLTIAVEGEELPIEHGPDRTVAPETAWVADVGLHAAALRHLHVLLHNKAPLLGFAEASSHAGVAQVQRPITLKDDLFLEDRLR